MFTCTKFCKNYSCNNSIYPPQCIFEVDHLGEICESSTYANTYCRADALCGFSPYYTKLCASEHEVLPTDKIAGIIIGQLDEFIPGGEKIRELTIKFNDNGTYKCGGWDYFYLEGQTLPNIIFPAYGDDYSTPEKDGFSYGEPLQLFARTDNHVCKITPTVLDPAYYQIFKWYPLSLVFVTGIEAVNFDNASMCCNVNDPNIDTCIENLNTI